MSRFLVCPAFSRARDRAMQAQVSTESAPRKPLIPGLDRAAGLRFARCVCYAVVIFMLRPPAHLPLPENCGTDIRASQILSLKESAARSCGFWQKPVKRQEI